jgi:predicted DNA-binding transcriptional regulator YafY
MYSPTTRLLTVLELLQSRKQISGAELARRLEVDIRTVRRYIVMLQDMGIPVEGERGPYGNYQLQRGHKLPPLMFTDGEAVALTLGLLAIREFRFPVDITAVEGALAKTQRVMPAALLYQTQGVQAAITFNVTPSPAPPPNEWVALLSTAVQQRRRVQLRYTSYEGAVSERGYDPYGIVYNEGYWYTAGYCHLRRDLRTFRMDRMAGVEPTEETFDRPRHFDALGYVLQSLSRIPGTLQIEILVRLPLEEARQRLDPRMGDLTPCEDGTLLRRRASELEWFAHFLLELEIEFVVLQPVELQEMLRRLAQKALRLAGDVPYPT